MKQYLYKIQPTRPDMLKTGLTPKETETIEQHFDYLQALSKKGVLVLAGRTLTADVESFGIVTFHAETEEFARSLMQNDPAVKLGIMRAELFPFRVALPEEPS